MDDLDRRVRAKRVEDTIANLRRKVRIAVIDDQDFSPLGNLQKHQYDITPFKDVPSISELKEFQIILVDLQGVGRDLNPSLQGAHAIREIKKNYPGKFVIAYTGGASQELLAPSIESADRFTQKDTAIHDWCALLDDAISDLSNPAYVWRKLRGRLLDAGVAPIDLAFLEDLYVRSFDAPPEKFSSNLDKIPSQIEIPEAASGIIKSLATSGIIELFKALFSSQ